MTCGFISVLYSDAVSDTTLANGEVVGVKVRHPQQTIISGFGILPSWWCEQLQLVILCRFVPPITHVPTTLRGQSTECIKYRHVLGRVSRHKPRWRFLRRPWIFRRSAWKVERYPLGAWVIV